MQNFKDVILKNLCSAVIFFTYLLVMPSVWMAEGADVPPQIFIGNGPSAITIQQGMPVEIPVFFVGGTYCDKTVELYVFRTEDGRNVCFGPEGWESDDAIALEDFKPLCNVPGLPEYLLLQWQAFKDSQSLSDFDLCICVDDQIDGIFTASSSCCGCQSIIIEEVDDNSTGDDTGTGDDSGSGGDTDTGDVSSPGLVAPPFPNLGGGSGGACSSLEYTTVADTASPQSSFTRRVSLGFCPPTYACNVSDLGVAEAEVGSHWPSMRKVTTKVSVIPPAATVTVPVSEDPACTPEAPASRLRTTFPSLKLTDNHCLSETSYALLTVTELPQADTMRVICSDSPSSSDLRI